MVYALLDDQSDCSFIKSSTAERLKVKGHEVSLLLSTILGKKDITSTKINGLMVCGTTEIKEIYLPTMYTRDTIPSKRSQIPKDYLVSKWPHLTDVSQSLMPYREDVEIGLLIGINCIQAIKPIEIAPGKETDPYGVKTHLGWGVIGAINGEKNSTTEGYGEEYYVNKVNMETLERMFNMDFIDHRCDEVPYSFNDTKFLKTIKEGIHLQDGHFEMPLPLKENTSFPNNRELALKRLSSQRKRLERNPTYKSLYQEYMLKLLENNHAEMVSPEEIKKEQVWYIPHHAVPKKSGELRVVFDCSAKYKNTSLNEQLLQGPDLTNTLVGVLSRFRQENYAFVCDIEAMFHQVRVNPEHRDLLRFVWWSDESLTEVSDYRMAVHLFGATSSPGCANYALKEAANQFEEIHGKEAANFIRRDFYVDDGLKSVDTPKKAVDLIKKSQELCRQGGFHLHKFLSNSKEVIDSIPNGERAKSIKDFDINIDQLPLERTLGVQWCVESDCFQFRIELKDSPLTRRGILSTVSSIFDPLGLVAPIVLVGKRILQDLCRDGFDWDDDIPEDIRQRWEVWKGDLHLLATKKIPRCYKPDNFGNLKSVQLHHFSDASLIGYGECSYLRLVNELDKIHCSLVMAKARVTPLKQITVPRLELTAAVVSTRISAILRKELDYKDMEEFFWTDSNVVLGYINNEARKFHIFVANRVQQIRNYSTPSQWYKIDTLNNPADDASRGLSTAEIIKKDRWWNGPEMLWHEVDFHGYAQSPSLQDSDPEVKCLAAKETEVTSIIQRLEYFSKWFNAKRAIANCLKIRKKLQLKRKDAIGLSTTTVEKLKIAENVILQQLQGISFEEEIASLTRDGKIKRGSTMYKLDPFIDTNGLLRVGGRIRNAHLPHDVVHPVILPKKSHITNLIIAHFHSTQQHQGRGITHNEIRSSGYWIIGGKSAVSQYITKCVECLKHRSAPQLQKMADLPYDRLTPAPPFTFSAVDCFGPFYIKERRSELKRYGVLFTCLVSRAIHIETANSLDTDSFLNAYRRFICRRGPIRRLRSDQGSNFVGAKNELEAELLKLDKDKIHGELLKDNCDFFEVKMNAPHSSHMGGVWERQIRSVRSVLNYLLTKNSKQLDDESLRTFMTEAEAIVNCRPLTVDSNDLIEPLTPNHLLTFKTKAVLPPPGEFSSTDLYCRKRWRRVQHLATEFWERWRKEFIQNLQVRQKWIRPTSNLQVDDIVIIQDNIVSRNLWKLGRVTEVYKGSDNYVRTVKLAIGDSTLDKFGKRTKPVTYITRPIHKLVLLVSSDSD